MKLTLLIIFAAGLSACKPELYISLNLSELLNGESKIINANSIFEISACESSDYPGEESNSLSEIKQKIPYHFEGAEFLECSDKGFQSYAKFSFPIGLDLVEDGKPYSDEHLSVFSNASKGTLVSFFMPEPFRNKVRRLEDETFSSNGFDIFIGLNMDVDTDRSIYGNTLWYQVLDGNIEDYKPVYTFKSDTKSINETRKKLGAFTVAFKPSQVIIDLALSGEPAPFLSIDPEP